MKVYLYQNTREPYFWTKDELENIENGRKDFLEKNKIFTIRNVEFHLRKYVSEFMKYSVEENFDSDALNVLILNFEGDFNMFKHVFEFNKNKKFLFVIKTVENYSHVHERYHDEFINYVSNSENIKVIWDVSEIKYKNFYFEPKLHLQNYYNNNINFPADLFLYGKPIFDSQTDKKRIGIHFNKAHTLLRQKIINSTPFKNNIYLTINSDCLENINNNISTNYTSNVYENNFFSDKFPPTKYIDSFINLNIKSEMELVYETFTQNSSKLDYIKLNEKTIKHLYLGKPFVHSDPVSHKLLEVNGLFNYKSLFTPNLYEIYTKTDTKKLLNGEEIYWLDALIDNIVWLSEMDENEWTIRIKEANDVAKKNRDKIIELIFNTSLINYIKNYNEL